ncbi:MAG TPA: ATP-binding protein [Ohtaekwangia sp.]|nr:ATP-binding protein [Ohtaekwangia sp.]
MGILSKLTNIGLHYAKSPSERRSILFSNGISITLAALAFLLFVIYLWWYGWSAITVLIPVIGIFCLSALLFNYLNLSLVSRLWMCLFLPIATMALSIYSKSIYYHRQEELDYFTFRIIILSCCVLPPIFFSVKEKVLLFGSSAIILTILLLHDPLHHYFGVPYTQNIVERSNYHFTNIIMLLMYVLMTAGVNFMKNISEKNELKAQILIEELHQTNKQLQEKNTEIELQNHEILSKSNNLNISQRELTDAYKIIEEQRNLLYKQNKHLSTELLEKNQELTKTNNELIKHNNELRQFSYTVSHNLRGPVASLMGLLKLFEKEELSKDNAEIFVHLETSANRLDSIIKDLSKIIDIRHDIFQIRQKINLFEEMNAIREVLNREINSHDISLYADLSQCSLIYSVKPMVHSILYNLISNAIKYRSPDRAAVIKIKSNEDPQYYVFDVEDNGLGINMKRDKDNLFKLYKRFHHHTEGKGLGLYLVKLQAEALGGQINVESELDQFTKFTVKLKKPENAARQILYQTGFAEVFYDAKLNYIGTLWQPSVTYEQYYLGLKKLSEFIKVYNTPNYVTDLVIHDYMPTIFKEEAFIEIIRESAENGLKRAAMVTSTPLPLDFAQAFSTAIHPLGINVAYFSTHEQAVEWIRKESELSLT